MTTIRELMLAQQGRHEEFISCDREPTERCAGCSEWWPCVERVAADAVLAQLGVRDAEIRQHLEAILRKHSPISDETAETCTCGAWPPPCFEQEHTLAILALLTPDEQDTP